MSALCQKRTHAVQQGAAKTAPLFDHLVGACEQHWRHVKAERFCGLEIDHQLHLRGLHYWQVRWFLALENPAGISSSLAMAAGEIASVAHQAARRSKLTRPVHRWQRVASRQRDQLLAQTKREWIGVYDERIGALL